MHVSCMHACVPHTCQQHTANQASAVARQRTCAVCFEDYDIAAGVECTSADHHFCCGDCLAGQVRAMAGEDYRARLAAHGGVRCVGCTVVYSESAIARHVPDATFAQYLNAKVPTYSANISLGFADIEHIFSTHFAFISANIEAG